MGAPSSMEKPPISGPRLHPPGNWGRRVAFPSQRGQPWDEPWDDLPNGDMIGDGYINLITWNIGDENSWGYKPTPKKVVI